MKKQLLTLRRALWKLVDQFTSPRQRALHKLYQEMADIKSALATLESQRSTSPAGNGLQGAAAKASNLWAPQASWNSLAFTTEFRGKFHDIKESQRDYLGYFIGEGPFLDGVFSAQVVEHLDPAYLVDVVNTIRGKLRWGGVLALETINPASLYAMNNAFYLDPSHVRPVHPHTLRFIVDQAGYYPVEVSFRAPVDPKLLLEEVPVAQGTSDIGRDTVQTLNRNLHRLNNFLYGHQDYALIGWRPNL